MHVTVFGIYTDRSEVQFEKESNRIFVTDFGMLIDCSAWQESNVWKLISVIGESEGMLIDCNNVQLLKAPMSIRIMLFGIFIEESDVQFSKAFIPIFVTEFGIWIDCSTGQPLNPLEEMAVTQSGIVTVFSVLFETSRLLLK